jgi:transcriptional regulator with XRE-family HTH domain
MDPALRMNPAEVRKIRVRSGLSQEAFWGRIGITQSGGSRYECGRRIPEPVELLLKIAYGSNAEATAAVKALRPSSDRLLRAEVH